MASFSAGTTFTDGVANDVTAAKLGALVNNATPTSGLIQDRTAETVTATNDTLLIGDASDSNNLKRITVANFAQTLPTAKVTTGTIDTATLGTTTGTAATFTTGTITTLTAGTTTSTAATITTGTITTGVIPTLTSTTLITSGTGTAASPAIVPTGDTDTGIFFPAADTAAIATQGTEAMRINSSGNVGVGTTSPIRKLSISGGGIAFQDSGGAARSIAFIDSNTNISSVSIIGDASTGNLLLNTNSFGSAATERLRIDSSGNVGIGTTSPSSILHISKTGAAFPSSSNPRIRLDEVSSGRFGIIEFDSSTNLNIWGSDAGSGSIRFFNGTGSGTERLRIDSSGNVGVGTTTPVNKLEVVGSFGRGAPVTKTADFTLADTENWLVVNKGSSCTVTLPAASSWTGREFTIKVITAHAVVSASSNVVPLVGGGAGTAILPATDGAWATLVSNGTNWVIMCGS